jgi:hypothetical protein
MASRREAISTPACSRTARRLRMRGREEEERGVRREEAVVEPVA